jgi:hypothetical protein
MKKNNMVLAGLLAGLVVLGFLVTYRNQSKNNTRAEMAKQGMTTCAARRASAEKDEKRNSLLRQLDKNQSALDRAKNDGQKQRLAKQAEKLQTKLNDLQ